jgi:hypothetical protein
MITLERPEDLLVILGPVGSEEDPDEQLPRPDFRVVAIVQQHDPSHCPLITAVDLACSASRPSQAPPDSVPARSRSG